MTAPPVDIELLKSILPGDVSLLRLVAQGGQSIVYEARVASRHVALKLVLSRDGGRERAEREVSAGYNLDHPNLVRIYDQEPIDIGLEGQAYCYFTEEFIEGDSLAACISDLDVCEILCLAADLTTAVEFLWTERRIVHRDIKPANIIRNHQGRFVLLDVGIGRHQTRSALTLPAALGSPGTPGYYSPEQYFHAGQALDHRSDLFLIGIVCYQAVTGHLPFDPDSPTYLDDLQAGLASAPDGVHELVGGLMMRLLAAQPHQRFRNCEKVSRAIARVREELGCS